jgi:hypothetical protein
MPFAACGRHRNKLSSNYQNIPHSLFNVFSPLPSIQQKAIWRLIPIKVDPSFFHIISQTFFLSPVAPGNLRHFPSHSILRGENQSKLHRIIWDWVPLSRRCILNIVWGQAVPGANKCDTNCEFSSNIHQPSTITSIYSLLYSVSFYLNTAFYRKYYFI